MIIPERIHRSTVFRFKKAQGRQYKIIDCDSAWELAEDINRMVPAGWLPDGDVFGSEYRINTHSYKKEFYQKMVIDYDKIERISGMNIAIRRGGKYIVVKRSAFLKSKGFKELLG